MDIRKEKRKTKIVLECGINHNGRMDIAKKLIDMAVITGIDYVKFQKRDVDLVYTKEELDGKRESPWGTTFREQKQGLEFGKEQYDEINDYCKCKHIDWFASPWDINSITFLKNYDAPYIKIPSALNTDYEYLEAVRDTGIPLIISTGMTRRRQLDRAMDVVGKNVEYILACTSTYPTPVEEINLNFIKTLKYEFPHYRIGFSNHFPGVLFISVAIALGAEMVEFHGTLSRAMYGSDQAASIELPGMLKIVDYITDLEVALGSGEWTVFPGEIPIEKKLRKK